MKIAPVNPRLWHGALGLTALALAAGLVLIIALALGWNDPRPTRLPDWQPPGLPLCLVASADHTAVTLLGWSSDDFTLEAQILPLDTPTLDGYGLVYRAQDAAHYYAFAVGSDGYYAVLRVTGDDETALVDWQQFPHIRRGQGANRLRVACVGPTCRFYVNDEFAATVEDATWLTGDVGLWARSFGDWDVPVQFLDLLAWTDR